MARKKVVALEKGNLVVTSARLTLKEVLDQVETDYTLKGQASLPRLKTSRKHLEEFFGPKKKVPAITGKAITKFVEFRLEEDEVTKSTVQKDLAALHRAFQIQHDNEVIERIPKFPTLEGDDVGRERMIYVPDGGTKRRFLCLTPSH
jgi:hypothetical protein